jgi:hypothetical protein
MKQIANVAALPGIVGRSVGLPDIHSGYGFAIGNMVRVLGLIARIKINLSVIHFNLTGSI